MNKNAYFKLMGLNKKAGPVDWIKNKYKDLQADQQIRDIKASAERARKRNQEAQKAEIAKGVTAAENRYKQERKQDSKVVAKIKADRQAREQRAADIARSNKVKSAQEEAANAALTPAQLMQKRILQQKARNAQNRVLNTFSTAKKNLSAPLDTALAFSKGTGEYNAKKQLEQALALKNDPMKLLRRGATNKFLAGVKKNLSAPLDNILTGRPLDKLLEQKGVRLPTPIEEGMSKLKQEQANALEAEAVRKGLGNVFMFDRFNKGNMSDAAKAALGQNIKKYTTYKDKGWWERLLAWLRQMWAGVSGGNPLSTERGAALQAGERAGNIWSGLSDKIQKGLLQGK